MRGSQKTMAMWAVFLVLGVLFFQMYQSQHITMIRDYNYKKFVDSVKAGEIESVSILRERQEIRGKIKKEFAAKYNNATQFQIVGDTESEGTKFLQANGIVPNYERDDSSMMTSLFLNWLPLILIILMFMFLFRQLQAGGGKAMSFGKSRAKLLTENKHKVTFKDVAGVEEAKQELVEIVDFLKDPKKFTRLGGRIPKGVLLVGPPGTGKTLLARAVAGEAKVPFFTISGSDFVEMFVGVGASRVRDLFEQGKKSAPCIIFIDEIDAVGRHRGAGLGGGHDEREQTLNQLLVEMDGFESNEGVILIAATNRPDVLDPALLRPGRFDRRVIVNRPDLNGRTQILKVHSRKTPLASNVDIERIARGTPGFSGADLENLVNEAALVAARDNKNKLEMEDFEKAKDKILMGSERKSMLVSDEDKRITAYHEAGHTLVSKKIKGMDPIHKVSIIPRGMALGVTQTLPKEDMLNLTKSKAENMIAFMFGGRAAEELVFQDYTTGAGNDIERATAIARSMVCEWGMSERIGPLAMEKREGPVFLGMQTSGQKNYSDSKAEEIDNEIHRIITDAHVRAVEILKSNREALEGIALALLEYETIDGEEVDMIIAGKTIEDLKNLRSENSEKLAAEQKLALEQDKKEAKESKKIKDEGGGDPVGNTGPVTA
jgi:cell division protease FtsH